MRAIISIIMIWPSLCAAGTLGDPPDPCHDFRAGLSCQSMKLSICPSGDFEFIRNGCGGTSDYIWIIIRDSSGNPVPGIPPSDFWMDACNPARQLCLCAEAILADSVTGPDGRTTISSFVRGGGCVPAGGLWIAVQGQIIQDPQTGCGPLCLSIVVKSPDLTGSGGAPDCFVNLSDLIPFGASYNLNLGQPGYNDCCDYSDDFHVNLSDFAWFGSHYQHHCP